MTETPNPAEAPNPAEQWPRIKANIQLALDSGRALGFSNADLVVVSEYINNLSVYLEVALGQMSEKSLAVLQTLAQSVMEERSRKHEVDAEGRDPGLDGASETRGAAIDV